MTISKEDAKKAQKILTNYALQEGKKHAKKAGKATKRVAIKVGKAGVAHAKKAGKKGLGWLKSKFKK